MLGEMQCVALHRAAILATFSLGQFLHCHPGGEESRALPRVGSVENCAKRVPYIFPQFCAAPPANRSPTPVLSLSLSLPRRFVLPRFRENSIHFSTTAGSSRARGQSTRAGARTARRTERHFIKFRSLRQPSSREDAATLFSPSNETVFPFPNVFFFQGTRYPREWFSFTIFSYTQIREKNFETSLRLDFSLPLSQVNSGSYNLVSDNCAIDET